MSHSRIHLAKPSKPITLTMKLDVFTHQKKNLCDEFPHLFQDQSWHGLLMSFGIDIGSIFASLLTLCYMFVRYRFLMLLMCLLF